MTTFLAAGVGWLLLCTPILAVFHGAEKRARLERDSCRDGDA
jgi:hypothetical protein